MTAARRDARIGRDADAPFPDPAAPGRLALAEPGRRFPVRPAPRAEERKGNPIIEWVLAKDAAMTAYLRRLRAVDRGLAEGLGDLYTVRDPRRRLITSLFLDFAHDQPLLLGETAMLMSAPARDAEEALRFVLSGVAAELGRPAPFNQGAHA
jgi:hypothetical protein